MHNSYHLTLRSLLFFVGVSTITIVFASCSASYTTNTNVEQPTTLVDNVSTLYEGKESMVFSSTMVFPKGLTDEEERKMRYLMANSEAKKILYRFGREVVRTTSWKEAHLLAQEYMKQTTGLQYDFNVQQLLASSMLRIYFCTQSPSLEVQRAVEYYLEILFKYDNYGDPNLKSAVLPLLIGYWPQQKISFVAQRIFETCQSPSVNKEQWMKDFYTKKIAMLQESDQTSKNLSAVQLRQKIDAQLLTQIHSFPKRLKPLMNMMPDEQDSKELYGYNADNFAILALLADGIGLQTQK